LVALLLAFVVWAQWPEHADVDPEPYFQRAAAFDARILRDNYGVPHVYGKRDVDVAYGIAYAHSEDDFATLQSVLLATRAQLAAHEGVDAAAADYLVQLLDFWPEVEARYESDLSPRTRALVEAYATGVNHYAALHQEQVVPGLLPVTGKDVVAGFAFKTPLFYGLQDHVLELFEPERRRSIAVAGDKALQLQDGAALPLGSNAVALAPSRSADGKTRLLVNSHQPFDGPVAWYEARLKSEEGWDMAGGVFPGTPIILHGHNRDLGWASTVNKPDLVDVYVLEMHPEDENLYRLDGEWKALERREIDITVKLWGRLRWTVKREVLRSAHGPVLRQGHGTYALRYAGMGEMRQVEQYYRMNKATNFDEWREAMRMLALPSINFVYADASGNIGYFYNARLPLRRPGFDWGEYLPGDRSDLIWKEWLSFDDLPQVVNPASGVVMNMNHSPFFSTVGDENPKASSFAPEFGIEDPPTNRGLRGQELFGADASITREEFLEYKYDVAYSQDSDAVQVYEALLALDVSDAPLLLEARELLARWDRRADLDNRSAAIALLSLTPVVTAMRDHKEAPDLRASFAAAAANLQKHFGRLDVPWGEVNRLRRGDVDLPLAGGPDTLRAVYGVEPGEDGRLVAKAGDCFVMLVEWDAEGGLQSESIHQYGSATLDESSPHFADQAGLFAAQELKPVLLDEAAVLRVATRDYRPGEGASAP